MIHADYDGSHHWRIMPVLLIFSLLITTFLFMFIVKFTCAHLIMYIRNDKPTNYKSNPHLRNRHFYSINALPTCMHALYFQLSNGLWFPPYQTLSAWSAETVRIFLNYVCTFFKKHPGKSSVFICLTSIALSWITSSLLKFQFISWKMYDCFPLFQFTFCDLIRMISITGLFLKFQYMTKLAPLWALIQEPRNSQFR